MDKDMVERLRDAFDDDVIERGMALEMCKEAADEIERLRKELQLLRSENEALRKAGPLLGIEALKKFEEEWTDARTGTTYRWNRAMSRWETVDEH